MSSGNSLAPVAPMSLGIELRTLIEQRRTLTGQVEQLRHELKKGSDEVAKLKREKQPADTSMAAMKAVGERITDNRRRTTGR